MFVFLHIPKTAGTTFRFIFENNFGVRHCHTGHTRKPVFSQADFEFARRFFPGLRSLAGHNLVNPLRLSIPEPFRMTFLREPVARVLSHYQDSVVRGHNGRTFEQCLANDEQYQNLQVRQIAGEMNLGKAKSLLEQYDFVGLTEKFDLSLSLLDRVSPCRLNLQYKKKIVAKNNQVKQTLLESDAALALAKEHNQLDLELYAFACNELFPAACRKSGLDPQAQAPSYNRYDGELKLRYVIGRLYNKVYRQACKLR